MKNSNPLANPKLVQGEGSVSESAQETVIHIPRSVEGSTPSDISELVRFGPKFIYVVPPAIIDALGLADGQKLVATITPEGAVLLSPVGTPKNVYHS